jgi:hypothetical protein
MPEDEGCEGWICLHRKALSNGWLKNHKLWAFWCYCLLKASHKEHKVIIGNQQITLQPGQFISGRKKASKETGLSEQQIRTCIDSLKTMQNLTIKTTNKFSVVTVVNWASYQSDTNKVTSKVTSNQPATNHIQQCNNVRKKNILGNFSQESEPYKLSILLFKGILENNLNSRLHHCNGGEKEKTLQGWAGDIEKLIRIDKQQPDLIERVIKFATTDPFWKPYILSGRKLKEKWDTLVIKLQPGSDKQKQEENSLGDRYRTL